MGLKKRGGPAVACYAAVLGGMMEESLRGIEYLRARIKFDNATQMESAHGISLEQHWLAMRS